MKKIQLIVILFFTFSLFLSAQTNYFYNGDGKKIVLKLRNDLLFLEKNNANSQTRLNQKVVHNFEKYIIVENIDSKLQKTISDENLMFEAEDGTLQALSNTVLMKPSETPIRIVLNKLNLTNSVVKLDSIYDMYIIEFNTTKTMDIANKIWDSGLVSFAEPSFYKIIKLQNPLYSLQWGFRNTGQTGGTIGIDVNVEPAWNLTRGNSNIKVAVLDEGVRLDHPDLQGNLLSGYDATGNNSNGAPNQSDYHGTACAGIIAAVDNNIGVVGIAPNCKMIPVRIAYKGSDGRSWITQDSWITQGINYAWNTAKADVLSNSWGGGSNSTAINNTILNAMSLGRNGLGAVVIFASGNDSAPTVSYPASLADVIAVGALTPTGLRADFSNYGDALDVVAPGAHIPTTTINGYTESFGGTSAACPHVAGIAALILSINPELTSREVRNTIESTCRKVGDYSYSVNKMNGTWNNEMGFGLVDAYAAVRRALGYKEIVSPNDLYRRSKFWFKLKDGSNATWSCTNIPGITINSSTGLLNNTNFDYTGNITITAATSTIAYTKVIYISPEYIDGKFIFNNTTKTFSEIHSGYPLYENGFDLNAGSTAVSNLAIEITYPGLAIIEGKTPVYSWVNYSMTPRFTIENNGSRIKFSRLMVDESAEIGLEIETGKGTISQMFYLNTGRFSPILYPFSSYRLSPLEVKLTDNTITVSESTGQERGISYTNLADNNSYVYEILDILGTYKMQKGNFKLYIGGSKDIDISTLPKGFYALTIYKNGERVHSGKFKK
ncbi:S8 family serine peptidase [uncultured Dysgonomonas sp.]|uniref:Peptidase S8/S53 domain-containing protein n=1 Tax=uncultured Dysgonomonas sp. TaxID=206096 RepID=A0A212JGJ4_9BACT|nr:S8 family serine peptidase [uncultured Dysgonomonas sp.]SBV98375.1 conserved exported hypothetical protein [uncultured Dysgonomonas sp.]